MLLAMDSPKTTKNQVQIIGKQPPERTSFDDLCPPVQCQECPERKDVKCKDSGVSILDIIGNWEVTQLGNGSYPGLGNRTTECILYAVGKPVYHRYTDQTHGWWMRDPNPENEKEGEKYYVTREDDAYTLYEYKNKSDFRKDKDAKVYPLNFPFGGNSHVVYNGSFYYNVKDQPTIVKLVLKHLNSTPLHVPNIDTTNKKYLYTTNNTYMDFSVDDNGLWVIYGVANSNNTAVMKVDANSMKIQYIFNLTLNHHNFGEMFVVCGALYAIDSVTERNSRIRIAYDFYLRHFLDVNLLFTNPFRRTTMVGYNHKHKELYTWDKGNQLTYPVRYHEIGYNQTIKDDKLDGYDGPHAQMLTGFDVTHENLN